jgi:hypothetical protein
MYYCKDCNKNYQSYTGIYLHNKKYHTKNEINNNTNNNTKNEINNNNNNTNNTNTNNNTNNNKIYNCRYCNSEYKYKQNRWRHEKTCRNENLSLKKQIEILTKKVNELSNRPVNININNNINNNNNNNNNTIIINEIGKEDISFLSLEDKQNILKAGLNSLFKLVEKINFNDNQPSNHNFCVTSINDKHASVIDTDNNKIIKAEKSSLFDSVAFNNFIKLESIANNPEFSKEEISKYKQEISKLKDMLFINNNGLKIFHNELNIISYNNKDMILDTWKKLKPLINE